jgi:hypothetical protein
MYVYLPSSHSGGWLPGNHRGLSLFGSWGSAGVGAWAAEMVVSPLVAAAILVTLKAFPPKNDVLAAPTLLATLLQDHKWEGHVKQPFPPPPPPAIAGGNSTSTQLKSPPPSH